MKDQDHSALLNDLIRINNDRIAGYEKALAGLSDGRNEDLRILFSKMITASHEYNTDLSKMVRLAGDAPATGTTGSGKLYRLWLDVKAVFTGIPDRKTLLADCEEMEDAVQSAYGSALSETGLPEGTCALLTAQKAALSASHDQVKTLRSMQDMGSA